MAPYIYGVRNGLHIIDLTQTAILMNEGIRILKDVIRKRGKILFVCTKKQGSEAIEKMAKACNQYYVNHKWLGGMLTNWKTISSSIRKIKQIESEVNSTVENLSKKEKVKLLKQKDKLEENFGGIKSMGGKPDLMFVIDVPKESLAISEAKSLNIPVIAITDTNANPDNIDYVIPGNDDSIKAIQLYCDIIEKSLKDIKLPQPSNDKPKKQVVQKKSKAVGEKNTTDSKVKKTKKVVIEKKSTEKKEEKKKSE